MRDAQRAPVGAQPIEELMVVIKAWKLGATVEHKDMRMAYSSWRQYNMIPDTKHLCYLEIAALDPKRRIEHHWRIKP